MTEPDHSRPGSSTAGYHGPSIPSSPRPSVASRASGSSLRKEREAAARPVSVAAQSHSQSQSPQPPAATNPVEGGVPEDPNAEETTSSFAPLFTLLSTSEHSSQRQTIHHPTVHYIFADDDPELLSAALRQHSLGVVEEPETEHGQSAVIRPGDRAIIVDMASTADGTGLEVASASSLSPDWAVISTQVSQMEGGGGEGGGTPAGKQDTGALMLKIEGVSIEPSQYSGVPWGKRPSSEAELQSSGGSAPPATGWEEYAGLLSDFDKRMILLRRVVESSVERQRMVQAAREGIHEEGAQQSGEDRTGPSPATAAGDNEPRE